MWCGSFLNFCSIFRYDVTESGPEDVYFCSDACFTEFDDSRKSVAIRISKEICPEIPIIPEGDAGRYYQSLRRHQTAGGAAAAGGVTSEADGGEKRQMSFFAAEHARRESLGLYDSKHNLRRRGSMSTDHKVCTKNTQKPQKGSPKL